MMSGPRWKRSGLTGSPGRRKHNTIPPLINHTSSEACATAATHVRVCGHSTTLHRALAFLPPSRGLDAALQQAQDLDAALDHRQHRRHEHVERAAVLGCMPWEAKKRGDNESSIKLTLQGLLYRTCNSNADNRMMLHLG